MAEQRRPACRQHVLPPDLAGGSKRPVWLEINGADIAKIFMAKLSLERHLDSLGQIGSGFVRVSMADLNDAFRLGKAGLMDDFKVAGER
jgi:hypothetical protein